MPATEHSQDQLQALDDLHSFARSGKLAHALAGPAGSGKTTIVADFVKFCPRRAILTATTNKAAAVAARMQGGKPKTIHSLLGLVPRNDSRSGRKTLFRIRKPSVKPGSLVVIDEASMVDRDLLACIFDDAMQYGFQVLFVGDAYQLPPVNEPTSPAFDAADCSHLTTIHRQAIKMSQIRNSQASAGYPHGTAYRVGTNMPGPFLEARTHQALVLCAFRTMRQHPLDQPRSASCTGCPICSDARQQPRSQVFATLSSAVIGFVLAFQVFFLPIGTTIRGLRR